MLLSTGCIGLVIGWIVSKVINTPHIHEKGRLGVYHSMEGIKLIRLVQSAYAGQDYVYVEFANIVKVEPYQFIVKANQLVMYTVQGEVINEANWDKHLPHYG